MNATLDRLRTGLHFSASALKTYLQCAWKFRLHYVEGATPEFRPTALILGSAVHEAAATLHRAVQAAVDISEEDLVSQFDEALESQLAGDVPVHFRPGEDAVALRDVGRSLVKVYARDAKIGKVVAVEQPFHADLTDPRTGEMLEPKLVGVFDLIESDEDGDVSVVELKTAAKRWSSGQVDLDLQGSLYAEAASQAGLVPQGEEALIRYEILVKNKTPVLDRQFAVRRPGDRVMARTIACDALQAIEAGAFFRNPGWACDGCQYRKLCGL